MRGIINLALAAAIVAGVTAQPHQHQHRHRHVKKHGHLPVEKRDAATKTVTAVASETVVAYVLDGKVIDSSAAEEGIAEGAYVPVGTSVPTSAAASSSAAKSSSSSLSEAAQFFEQKVTSSSSAPSATPTSSSTAAAATSSASGIDVDFPSGKIPCSTFPSAYGAVAVDWVGTDGWSSLQEVGSYTPGVAISNIVAPTSGGCKSGMFCSYACPPGYQKTQWPETSQGSTGQSVGGLWCNSDGYLELTRSEYPKICEQGAGGVYIVNKLTGTAAICRTDYPASENMVIPLETSPGGTYPLTNPDATTYYVWQGKTTTAQYYVNNMNVALDQACVWTSSSYPSSAGNWAPTNIGVGMDSSGITYISIFPNSPTSTATLNFNIEITGDVTAECYLKAGVYSSSNGCTTGMQKGGTAYITLSN